jgi:NAD(P)-dependent dehydrogenase (short-subunit alcohol dehydrogenase family)
MSNDLENKKVWFVTGASKGLGLTLVKRLLGEGFRVAATSRNAAALIEAVGEKSDDFLPLEMDLLKRAKRFGSGEQNSCRFRRNRCRR